MHKAILAPARGAGYGFSSERTPKGSSMHTCGEDAHDIEPAICGAQLLDQCALHHLPDGQHQAPYQAQLPQPCPGPAESFRLRICRAPQLLRLVPPELHVPA